MSEYLVTAEEWFRSISTERLIKEIAHYELLVAIEENRAPIRTGQDIRTKNYGKEIPYTQTPWMYKHWLKGLELANAELQRREQSENLNAPTAIV